MGFPQRPLTGSDPGCDFSSAQLLWNLNSRLLWLRRNSGENVFGVQVEVSLSPGLGAGRR